MKSFDSEKLWSAFPVQQHHLTKLDAVYIFPHPTHTNSLLNIYEKRQPHFHQLLSGRYALPPAGWAGNQTHIFISISYIPHFCFALKTYPRAGLMIPSHGLGEGKAYPRQHFIWISHFVQRAADVRILYHFFVFVRSLCLYGIGGAGTVANVVEWLPRGHWSSGRSYDRSRLAVVGLFPEWLIKPTERAAESKLSTKGSLSLVSFFLLRWFLASPFFHLQIHTHTSTHRISLAIWRRLVALRMPFNLTAIAVCKQSTRLNLISVLLRVGVRVDWLLIFSVFISSVNSFYVFFCRSVCLFVYRWWNI